MNSRVTFDHDIESWDLRVTAGLPAADLIGVYTRAFALVWQRTVVTLGDTSLIAITDRVLWGTRGRFPWLGATVVGSDGIVLAAIAIGQVDEDELRLGLRSFLVGFFDILTRLTGDALAPQVLQELTKLGTEEHGR